MMSIAQLILHGASKRSTPCTITFDLPRTYNNLVIIGETGESMRRL